ncbi:hypothetical protein [Aquabacterium sp.]|uniref:hypothetical protein n=1 Tax=Aquabacterium sp. TaxID=1872578 RepID=UPI004037E766
MAESGRDTSGRSGWWMGLAAASILLMVQGPAQAEDKPVYRCPGNLYTDALTAKEAAAKGCKTLDGAPITVIQSVIPKGAARSTASSGSSAGGEKVSSDDQKARDADRRKILEAELRKEEEALAALQKEYNNGQPDRKGDERNFQKYQDRVNEMKAAITRKEADVAALKREVGNLGSAGGAPAGKPAQ